MNIKKRNMNQAWYKGFEEQIISVVIAIVLAVIFAVISCVYPQHITLKDSIYIGFFAYLISILSFFTKRLNVLDYIKDIRTEVNHIFNYLSIEEKLRKQSEDSFSVFWNLCLLRAREGIYEFVDSNTIKIPKDQFPTFWQQAILNTDINWSCTNFVNLNDDLYSDWATRGFQFQSMVSKTMDVPVKRLYICKNRNEVDQRFIEHLKWQESLGFRVRLIIKEEKSKWARFEELEKLIDTIDIAIINGRYLIAFLLTGDDQRGISFLRVYSDTKIVGKVNDIFHHIWGSAIPVESIDILLDTKEGNKK